MKKSVCLLALFFIMISCGRVAIEKNVGNVDIQFNSIAVESINVQLEKSSNMGFSGMSKDSLYFFDKHYNYFYNIATDGTVGSRQCGLGRGPKEFPIQFPLEVGYDVVKNNLVALGGNNDLYLLGNMEKACRVAYKMGDTSTVSYSSAGSYTIWSEVVADFDGKYLYYNVQGNDDAVSILRSDYYRDAAIILRVDVNSGEVVPMGRYSRYYDSRRDALKHLPFTYFDVAEDGNIYVVHQADPLIHCYNKNFELQCSFGFDGAKMNTKYSNPGSSAEQFMAAYERDLENAGYYYWVQHINGYTFRSYKKGGGQSQNGLQIYKGKTLIADVEVPADFRVVGYVEPYFVTKIICDDNQESLKFYRFKL